MSFSWLRPSLPFAAHNYPCYNYQGNFEEISSEVSQKTPISGISQLVAASNFIEMVIPSNSFSLIPNDVPEHFLSNNKLSDYSSPVLVPNMEQSANQVLNLSSQNYHGDFNAPINVSSTKPSTVLVGTTSSNQQQPGEAHRKSSSSRLSVLLSTTSKKEKQYSCRVCQKKFAQKGNLKTHMLIHTGEKPFPCLFCGKYFTQKGNVETHMKVHTGVRDYPCDVCGKGFTQKGNLRQHMRSVHIRVKPFRCDVCSRSFTQKVNLQAHQRIHYSINRLPCNICGKSFAHKGSLKNHIRGHADMSALEEYVQRHQAQPTTFLEANSPNQFANPIGPPTDHLQPFSFIQEFSNLLNS